MFVVKGETSRSHEIDEKCLHEELGSSDRSVKPERLSENIRVKHAHDGTAQPVEQSSSRVTRLCKRRENTLVRALRTLLVWVLLERLSRSAMCSARVPVWPGAVRAAYRRPAKGRSSPMPGTHYRLMTQKDVDSCAHTWIVNELARPVPVLSVGHLHHG